MIMIFTIYFLLYRTLQCFIHSKSLLEAKLQLFVSKFKEYNKEYLYGRDNFRNLGFENEN